ncbi:MAG: TonB-dependent receptor [Bacteroides sp.]|nr:TonB-dependent receptor [Bacteroides sp.]
MRKITIACCLCLLSLVAAHAQMVSGKLTDSEQNAIAYANVVLQTTDSAFVTGTTTNEKGDFALKAPQAGSYLLQLSYMGYRTETIRLEGLEKKRDLGTLTLSEDSEMLDEVTVTASGTVKKVDRQIVYPSEKQLKQSESGYDLLARLMLPDLQVDPIQSRINTIGGGSVEIRINDRTASQAQVAALRPTEVVRIEYIDNPGARYGDTGVEAVINYIVKRRESGVSGGVQGMNAFTTGFGNDYAYLYANTGKSEFGVNYFISYRDYDDRYTEGYDRFSLPDGTTRHRNLQPVEVPFAYTQHSIEASYNLTEPDKYVFNVLFTDELYNSGKQDNAQRMVEEGLEDRYHFTHREDRYNSPSLDLFFSRNLPRGQKFAANAVGTLISTDYTYDYREYETEDETLSHYAYATDGRRYSLIGEAIYSKEWKAATLSAGLKGNTSYTRNVYTGDSDKTLHMHNSSLYGYVQLQGQWQKLNYMLGAGVSRQAFSESDNSYSFVTFRPSVSLSYPLSGNSRVRYSFSLNPQTPSLSQLSDVTQQNNDLEITRGNRDLDPYRIYTNRLTLSWNPKHFSAQLSANYSYYDSPILKSINPITDGDGSYLIEYASENGKSHRTAGARLNLQWSIVPDQLTVSGYGGVNWYRSEGTDYTTEYTAWTGGLSMSGNYKNFSLSAGASLRPKSLYGHYIDYGEKYSYVQLTYKYKNLSVGAACLYPFTPGGWTGGSRIVGSEYVDKTQWTHIKDNGNMVCIYFNWRFSSGRKSQAGDKTMSNKDTDSGVVK